MIHIRGQENKMLTGNQNEEVEDLCENYIKCTQLTGKKVYSIDLREDQQTSRISICSLYSYQFSQYDSLGILSWAKI